MFALLVSAALPFLIGLATFETTGFRYFLEQRGKFHQSQAAYLARSLAQASDAHGDVIETWLFADAALLEWVSARDRETAGIPASQLARETRHIDELWPSMPDDDPQVAPVLQNPAANSLRRFMEMHPVVVEIFATDSHGRLVASSGRTSDYNQADEEWWWEGSALPPDGRWSDIPRYDSSSGTFTMNVVLPLYDDDELVGVIKLLADVSSMFSRLGDRLDEDGLWKIVMADGHVLASSRNDLIPIGEKSKPATMRRILENHDHWFLEQDSNGEAWMTGVATLVAPEPTQTAYVLFSSRRDDVVAPLQRRFLQIGAIAIAVLTICTLVGFGVLRKNILVPLATLARASRMMTEITRLKLPGSQNEEEIHRHYSEAITHLKQIESIKTGDEIEELAADFAEMSMSVMRHQEELETRIVAGNMKTHGAPPDDITSPADSRES
ncbi:MAG TPA: cache domain-containing protein [Luteolibacter sp.]|nr:cache domain-containing protein [Luteolibacter sp.]